MSAYNTLIASMTCPRCGSDEVMEVDLYFGDRQQFQYALGSKVRWLKVESVANGGRPANGCLQGEGYGECPSCKKDFFAAVIVERDTIVRVEVDDTKPGYIAD